MSSNIRDIEQERAEAAFGYVKNAKESLGNEKSKNYKSYVKKVPMLIKTNGLRAAMAFIYAKARKEEAYRHIYEQMGKWLQVNPIKAIDMDTNRDAIISKVLSLEGKDYRMITLEILALFTWLKRFAEGMIDGEASSEN